MSDTWFGFFMGLFVGVWTVLLVDSFIWPEGDKSMSRDCLSDKPNICRTITTYTTPYKEER